MSHGQPSKRKPRPWTLALLACWPLAVPAVVVDLDLAPFRAATCSELQGEYRATLDVNRAVLEEMRRTDKETGGSNLVGPGSFASLGYGMFPAEESNGPEAALVELEAYQSALVRVAGEKKCALPGSGPGPETRPG